jgi:hypothetical protein
MFAMFTRLSSNEEVPRTESLEPEPLRARSKAAVRLMLFVPLAAVLLVSAVFLGVGASLPFCSPTSGPHGAMAGQSHSRNCMFPSSSRSLGNGR